MLALKWVADATAKDFRAAVAALGEWLRIQCLRCQWAERGEELEIIAHVRATDRLP